MRVIAISLLMVFFFSANATYGQNENSKADALVEQGDVLYKNKGSKAEALEKYKAAIEIQPENVRANYMVGLCYLQTSQKSRSLNYFLKAHDIEPDFVPEIKLGLDLFPDLRFLIAKAYQVGENYTMANQYFGFFKESVESGNGSRYSQINKGAAIRTADRKIFECLVAEDLQKKPLDSRYVNIKGINSPYPDYGPVFTPDGKQMYFTSRRSGGASPEVDDDLHFFEDIYVATRDSAGNWSNPRMVTEISTPGHESVLCISPDGKTMVISKGDGNGDLFMANKKNDGTWGTPVSMGKNINTSSRETAAYVTARGNKIFFISDRSGGFGGTDIYYSERRSNGNWGSAVNLGPKVNTIYDEDAPSLNKEGNALYFSSKGHKAMGGFDVFKASWDAGNQVFKSPENMGFPINSVDDDNTYVSSPEKDKSLAYYSSFKENGVGDLDIYQILQGAPVPDSVKKDREEFKELAKANEPLMENQVNNLSEDSSATAAMEADRIAKKEAIQNSAVASSESATKGNFEVKVLEEDPSASTANGQGYYMYDPMKDLQVATSGRKETAVRILVLDTDSRIPLDGDVVFIDQDTKEKITPARVRNGVYEILIANTTAKDFMVSIEKEGFHFKNIMVNVPPASKSRTIFVTRNIELKRHTLNKPRILRNVYFDFDQAEISERSNHELDMLHKMLSENDKLIIEVSGHADFLGEDEYNIDLSKKRAEKVVAYLTSKGIDKGRLRAMGYGEKKPAPGTDSTENGRALNRRTEFMIMAQ